MNDFRCIVSNSTDLPKMIFGIYPAAQAEEEFAKVKDHFPDDCYLADPKELGIRDDMDLEEKVAKLLGYVCGGAEVYTENNKLKVYIEWGDWKHEHKFADHILDVAFGDELMYKDEVVMEEDGSDCYSAEHIYEVEDDLER